MRGLSFKLLLLFLLATPLYSFVEVVYENFSDPLSNKQKYEDYLVAEIALARDDLQEAEKRFANFAKIGDKNLARHGILRTWAKADKFEQIAKTPNTFDLNDIEMQLIFTMAYLNTNNYLAGEDLLTKLLKAHPKHDQIAYFNTLLLINTGRVDKALKFVDSFLSSLDYVSPRHSFFYFLKSKIYIQMNKLPQATTAIDKSLELNGQFGKGWLLKAMLSEELKKPKDAIQAYKTYLDVEGENPDIRKKIVVMLFNGGDYLGAEAALKELGGNTHEYFYDLALIQFKGGKRQDALKNVNASLKLKNDLKQARVLKIDLLLKTQQIDEAVRSVGSWIKSNPSDKSALGLLAALQKFGIPKKKLIDMLHGMVDKGLKHKNVLAALSDMYVDIKNPKAAIPYHEKILNMTRDELLKSKILYQMAYAYFTSSEMSKVEPLLKRAVSTKKVFAPAYNLLAYYYANKSQSLDYAQTLVDKALETNESNPSFLDTKGYVYLKQGNTSEAKKYFKKALISAPHDQTIQEHLNLVS